MAFYKATVAILLQCDSEAEARAAVAVAFRRLLDKPELTAFIDWRYPSDYHSPREITTREVREFKALSLDRGH